MKQPDNLPSRWLTYYSQKQGRIFHTDLPFKDSQEFKIPGRRLDIRLDSNRKNEVIAQVWEIRDLLDPLDSPVIEWEYGQLSWPGIEGTVTDKTVRQLGPQFVYVSDSVLQYYEERPDEYSICPEIGSVSYQNQWSYSCFNCFNFTLETSR